MRRELLLIAAALALAAPQAVVVSEAVAQDQTNPEALSEAVVETATGVYPFTVEVADDPAERARGLMFRREIPADRGMLFDMGETRPVGFWMKNTYVSLDIIYIGPDGRVVGMAEHTVPLSETVLDSGAPTRWVLELVAGTARKIGLRAGDRVRHPSIRPAGG